MLYSLYIFFNNSDYEISGMKAYCKRKIIVVGSQFSLDGVVLVVCGVGGGLGAVEKTVPVRCCNVEGRWRVRRPWGGGRRRPWPASVTSRAKPANLLPLASSQPPPPHTTRPDHLSNCLATVYWLIRFRISVFGVPDLGVGMGRNTLGGGGVSDGFDFVLLKGLGLNVACYGHGRVISKIEICWKLINLM